MATTANSSSNSLRDNLSSPKSQRITSAAATKSAWTQVVVRGGGSGGDSSEAIAATVPSLPVIVPSLPEEQATAAAAAAEMSSDCSPAKLSYCSSSDDSAADSSSDNGNGNAGKKPAWNKPPSNGAVVEIGPIMGGAVSWPALSESARTSQKSSSDSLKALSDGSISVSQGTEIAPSTQKPSTNNKNPNSNQNHTLPTRQKSMKRHGGNGSIAQSPAPAGPVVETASSNNSSNTHKNSNWETGQRVGSGSHSHSGNDHPQPRNSVRRGNGGPHPRGDGSYNHNYGGRRDHQDRANRDWNPQRRDIHMQPPGVPRGFIRPPPHNPFIGPPNLRSPFVSPMGFSEFPMYYVPGPHPEPYRGMPFVPSIAPHAMYYPIPDPQLRTKLMNQIEYYFSSENLIKDTYLRQNMDNLGWVPIALIAGFKKVSSLTQDIQLVLDVVHTSNFLEAQEDRVRRRNDWMRWLMQPAAHLPTTSRPQSLGSSHDTQLTTRVQNLTIVDDVHGGEASLSRSPSVSNSPSQPSSDAGQVNLQGGKSS